jgi:hypothetical protein
MQCKVGPKGAPGVNSAATQLIKWCDWYWQQEHAGDAVDGDAEIVGRCESPDILKAYVEFYIE